MTKSSRLLFRAARYRVEVSGKLDKHWSDWFEGATITGEQGKTIIVSDLLDQSGLHGLLTRICDLGLPIVSLYRLEPTKENNLKKRCCDE